MRAVRGFASRSAGRIRRSALVGRLQALLHEQQEALGGDPRWQPAVSLKRTKPKAGRMNGPIRPPFISDAESEWQRIA